MSIYSASAFCSLLIAALRSSMCLPQRFSNLSTRPAAFSEPAQFRQLLGEPREVPVLARHGRQARPVLGQPGIRQKPLHLAEALRHPFELLDQPRLRFVRQVHVAFQSCRSRGTKGALPVSERAPQ